MESIFSASQVDVATRTANHQFSFDSNLNSISTPPNSLLTLALSTSMNVGSGGHTMSGRNFIIDARPLGNAVANRAMGAGFENTDYYQNCQRIFMGIENIHVMRDSLSRFLESYNQEEQGVDRWMQSLDQSGWFRHLKMILDSSFLIAHSMISLNANILIHCSDGWDRTAQLSSIASILLDPYYRTISGFIVLVEKEWISFGHKFADRCGQVASGKISSGHRNTIATTFAHYSSTNSYSSSTSATASPTSHFMSANSSREDKETSPVFHQFIECVQILIQQFPEYFEFTTFLLQDILNELMACRFGTFLMNCENERTNGRLRERSQSLWSAIGSECDLAWQSDNPLGPERVKMAPTAYRSLVYCRELSFSNPVIIPNLLPQRFWHWKALYARFDDNLHRRPMVASTLDSMSQQNDCNQMIPMNAASILLALSEQSTRLELEVARLERALSMSTPSISAPNPLGGSNASQSQASSPIQAPFASNTHWPALFGCTSCHLCRRMSLGSGVMWHCLVCGEVVCMECSWHHIKIGTVSARSCFQCASIFSSPATSKYEKNASNKLDNLSLDSVFI